MIQTKQFGSRYRNFEVVHQTNNQVRIKASCLYQDPERAYILEILLLNREAIEIVQSVPEMASVAVQFDPLILPRENLLILLDAILTNIGSKSSDKIQQIRFCSIDPSVPETKLYFAINGLSCASCALYLEMVLKRDGCITQASVDFASATAQVQGRLGQDEICSIVKSHGYEAVLIDEKTQQRLKQKKTQKATFYQEEPVLSIWL